MNLRPDAAVIQVFGHFNLWHGKSVRLGASSKEVN